MNNDDCKSTKAIDFDSDWRYIRLTNISLFDDEFTLSSYDDHDWQTIQLPHYDDKKSRKFTSTCVSYLYRKRFDLKKFFDQFQHIYLHFEQPVDNKQKKKSYESDMKIPSITIWLNDMKIFSGTLPEPISLTSQIKTNSDNLIVIYSKHGFLLRLHARLVLPRQLIGQIPIERLPSTSSQDDGDVLDYRASFDDSDGLIALFVHAVRKHAKRNGIDSERYIDQRIDERKAQLTKRSAEQIVEQEIEIIGPIPRLTILILIVGTRGDVQPFIALAKTLIDSGHRVRLATHETFRKFVRENGIEFYPLAGDPADLMSFMVKNAGIVPSVSSIVAGDIAKSRRVLSEILSSTWKACIEDDDETGLPFVAEAIIANPPSYGHIHCAQKLQIPLHIMFTMPWSPTVQFPHPFCKVDYDRDSSDKINLLSYDLVEVLTWSGMRNIINDFRKDELGLPILHLRQAIRIMLDEHVPHTYCWSPSLVPKPEDWLDPIDVSGFFFLDLATNFKPPEDILQFLKSGDPPIYIGFGSITGHDSDRILQAVLEALQTTGYRGLLSGFDVDIGELPSNALKIGNCPHDWLFQYVAAVCHHGGAGTTAAGLRAGKPTIIVPFFGDQFFWGSMISKSGAGPPPMPGKTVTAKQFASAFEFVHDPETIAAAVKISKQFKKENGCEVAVRQFHSHLPLDKMRSDLEPSYSACFKLNEYNLQISRPVAQVLIATGAIQESQLTSNQVYTWKTITHGDRFEAFTRGIKRAVNKISDSMHRLKRSKSMANIDRDTSNNTLDDNKHESVKLGRPFKDLLPLYGQIKEKSKKTEDVDLKKIEAEITTATGEATTAGKQHVRQKSLPTNEKPVTDDHQNNTNSKQTMIATSPYRKHVRHRSLPINGKPSTNDHQDNTNSKQTTTTTTTATTSPYKKHTRHESLPFYKKPSTDDHQDNSNSKQTTTTTIATNKQQSHPQSTTVTEISSNENHQVNTNSKQTTNKQQSYPESITITEKTSNDTHQVNTNSKQTTNKQQSYPESNTITKNSSNDKRQITSSSKPPTDISRRATLRSRVNTSLPRTMSTRTRPTTVKQGQNSPTKARRTFFTRKPPLPPSKASVKISPRSPIEEAAYITGLPVDVCQNILSNFNQLKHDRHHSTGDEKTVRQLVFQISLH